MHKRALADKTGDRPIAQPLFGSVAVANPAHLLDDEEVERLEAEAAEQAEDES